MDELKGFHLPATIAFNCAVARTQGDRKWRRLRKHRSSGLSDDISCEKWSRLPTALFMKWNSAENFPDGSPSRRAASFGTWQKSRLGSPRADQPQSPARNLLMSGNGDRARFDRRVRFKQRHRRRDEYRNALLARDPCVDDVRPLLHHMAALNFVLRLVVDSA
jgi:hypothetical protein